MNKGLESIIPEKKVTIKSLLKTINRFLGSAFLATVFTRPLTTFIEELNKNGVFPFGSDFSAELIIWEGGIIPNIFRIFISLYTASIFGFFFGYFSKRVKLSMKALTSIVFPFLTIIVISLFSFFASFFSSEISQLYNSVIYLVFNSLFSTTLNSILSSLNLLAYIFGSFFFINIGQKVRNSDNQVYDRNKSGTLLDIKWFHYLWLQIPLHSYFLSIIVICYLLILSAINLFSDFPYQLLMYGRNFFLNVFILFLIIGLIFYLLSYLRKLLIGEKKHHWAITTLLIVLISVIIPVLIILFAYMFI